ncbi:hypothetical protein BRC98_00170 [Halobacteriales archaeon QS_7_68_65]|nr:MAG: hypothetical protein BRC98_00170 [Halobacteriales archaeon QS_7_68_65]
MADDDEDRRRTDEMSLDELRGEIETIDRELVELIARRTYVAETVAEVKYRGRRTVGNAFRPAANRAFAKRRRES